MTTTADHTSTDDHPTDPLVDLLELTASAWSDAIDAVVHQDHHAARRALAGRAHLQPDLRPEVATLRRLGAERLHALADHGHRDLAYLACSRELDGVTDSLVRHARTSRRSEEATGLCVALAAGVKEASRHAARAA